MAKPPGLFQRKGTYYYRVRVPVDLVDALGKKEVRKCLHTKSHTEAKKLRDKAALECTAQFEDARSKIKQGQIPKKKLTRSEAMDLARDYLMESELTAQTSEEKRGSLSEDEFQDLYKDLKFSEQTAMDRDHPDTLASTQGAIKKILESRDIELDITDDVHKLLLEYLRRAELEFYRRAIPRLQQDYSHTHFDKDFASTVVAHNSIDGIASLGEVAKTYLADYEKEAASKGTGKKAVEKVRATLDFIVCDIGTTTAIGAVNRERCRQFRDILATLPANAGKLYKGLSHEKAAIAAKKDGKKPMAYETQATYLQGLHRLLTWASQEGLINKVPSTGLTPLERFCFRSEHILRF